MEGRGFDDAGELQGLALFPEMAPSLNTLPAHAQLLDRLMQRHLCMMMDQEPRVFTGARPAPRIARITLRALHIPIGVAI